MGAKAVKLGSWDKYPAYCWDWNVERVVYAQWNIYNSDKGSGTEIKKNDLNNESIKATAN